MFLNLKRKKGFTLIELLAVIIILGVLVIVAIPAVTSYISESRKSSYITTTKNLISGARTLVNSGKLGMYDTSVTYYIPYDMIPTENGTKTPYGDITEGYVVVTYNGQGYEYYWTGTDTSEEGIYLTYLNKLENSRIMTGVKEITTDVAICGKEKVVVFNKDGSKKERKDADDCINQGDLYSPDTACEYKLITTYGSFSTTSDVKEICVKIIPNYTHNYKYTSVQLGYYDGAEVILNVALDPSNVKDSSYIRVYNNSNKDVLLAEFTKNDYPKYPFFLFPAQYVRDRTIYKSIGHTNQYYIDMSPDLERYREYPYVTVMYGGLSDQSYTGAWLYKQSDINKVYNLYDTLGSLDMDTICGHNGVEDRAIQLYGFTNCDENDNCSGNEYHAEYYIYCDGVPR